MGRKQWLSFAVAVLLISASSYYLFIHGANQNADQDSSSKQNSQQQQTPAAKPKVADLVKQKRWQEALELIEADKHSLEAPMPKDELLWTEAMCLAKLERNADSIAKLEALLAEFPASIYAAPAMARMAEMETAADPVKGNERLLQLIKAHPDSAEAAAASQSLTQYYLFNQANPAATRAALSLLLKSTKNADSLAKIKAALTELNKQIVFSPAPCEGAISYTVQPGDLLDTIGKKHAVPAQLIARINGLQSVNRIFAGQTLKIIPGPFDAVVDTQAMTLTIWQGEQWIKEYTIGIGKDRSTPIGEFTVSEKLENPDYEPVNGNYVSAGPNCPLGTRWIEFTTTDKSLKHYGIHGTNEPSSIGKNESQGCIRMHNADVEEVFTFLIRNKSRVIIK